MACPRAVFSLLTALIFAGWLIDAPEPACAQSPSYTAVTRDSVIAVAEKLKQDLENGSILLADLHAMQVRLALAGVLRDDVSGKIGVLEQRPSPDANEPSLTAGLVPVADKLIQDLNEPDLTLAKRDAEQLAAQIHKQHEVYRNKQLLTAGHGSDPLHGYFELSSQLEDSIRTGDIAAAAALAVEVQSAEDAIIAAKKNPPLRSSNIYNVNDALGRAAFLRQDYAAASDYLLKAADTPGKNPALSTFGPDMWLARALSEAGYRDVVITFLERCKAFWPGPHIDEWISALQEGRSPNFSHNIWSAQPVLSH